MIQKSAFDKFLNSFFIFVFVLERDAFDALFDNAPEKLNVVKKVTTPCISFRACITEF